MDLLIVGQYPFRHRQQLAIECTPESMFLRCLFCADCGRNVYTINSHRTVKHGIWVILDVDDARLADG